jgi:hypothetical protein
MNKLAQRLILPFTAADAGIREMVEEKRQRVLAALQTDPGASNREVGRRLKINHHFVGDVRRAM